MLTCLSRSDAFVQVWSQRSCSCVIRATTPIGLFSFRRSALVQHSSRLNRKSYSTNFSEDFRTGSKRRSRGLVMAAKKASEVFTYFVEPADISANIPISLGYVKTLTDRCAKQEEGRYKHTIDLPKTTFGMRANAVVREPEIQKLWDENQVFKKVVDKNNGGSFILHDGPPYANGNLHIGHALNKILKDIINRYKLLQNFKVQYVPGWDCHGLPIELKGKYLKVVGFVCAISL
ncbi:hypothetical protein GIB67_023024 [Kingdonia uniflora]|uniref:Aminoacyl-tRNA synthetase class Ia domain-containing protein n=1 Tax=Kingdonia uniflora TaxID=39325 RepID=A0A7J7P2K5_9MAGN|nr:hypothetical protein GIB67_023024 [Kingdonia uniflora]